MEKLTVKNLGPIKDFTLETNRLTVLIGPQASGKSLLAQMVYLFRDHESLFAERFVSSWKSGVECGRVLRAILDDMRGASFDTFCDRETCVKYRDSHGQEYSFGVVGVDGNGRAGTRRFKFSVNDFFEKEVNEDIGLWVENNAKLTDSLLSSDVYIPTERTYYSRMVSQAAAGLYSEAMPLVLRRFSGSMEAGKRIRGRYSAWINLKIGLPDGPDEKHQRLIDEMESNALRGNAHWSDETEKWVWLVTKKKRKQLVLEAMSSGQMEAWPFFWLARTFGEAEGGMYFYFEEPETHLHPNAQVEVIKTIASLISRGHRFFITTHSPFILYVINNLIQAHIAHDGKPPEGEFSINPDHVAAYCLGDKPHSIMDKQTRLLNLDEIDDVFDDIGEYFQTMLEKAYEKRNRK